MSARLPLSYAAALATIHLFHPTCTLPVSLSTVLVQVIGISIENCSVFFDRSLWSSMFHNHIAGLVSILRPHEFKWFHVVVLQRMAKKCTEFYNTRIKQTDYMPPYAWVCSVIEHTRRPYVIRTLMKLNYQWFITLKTPRVTNIKFLPTISRLNHTSRSWE